VVPHPLISFRGRGGGGGGGRYTSFIDEVGIYFVDSLRSTSM